MNSEPRHIATFQIDEQAMALLFHEGATFQCIEGVPSDAKLLGVHADFERMSIVAMFEHPSFLPRYVGAVPHQMPLQFRVIDHPAYETTQQVMGE